MKFESMQQRAAIRRDVQIPCTLIRASDRRVVGRRGLDLSQDGMLVGAMDEVAPGERMIVLFTFTQFALPFHIEGHATRILRGQRVKDRMPAVAMRFDSLDPVGRLILRGHLRRIPPVLPARARRVDYAATISRLLEVAA